MVFPKGFGGSLASSWSLDPPGPPWKLPWPGNKQETAMAVYHMLLCMITIPLWPGKKFRLSFFH